MRLKSLEFSGFKSFAKKTEFEFKTPITAVVGPNGSGKSNIVEAFRFVLGEQSLKSMRGKRGEDLIWNGGRDGGTRSNRASVKIVFDNSEKNLDVDFDEVALERVVYRDSLSEYLINGSQVRLKDITELLAGAHVGASGHHIISQGEADHILVANSKERREMIEDALGLKIYQYKKRESERKLEKTRENISQVESLRKEIIPHLRFLRKQVEKIEKTLELKGELKRLYDDYLRREFLYIEFQKRASEAARVPLEKELKKFEEELAEAKKILSAAPGGDQKREKIIDIEKRLNNVRGKRETLNHETGRIEGEIAGLERVIAKKKDSNRFGDIPYVEVRNLTDEIEKRVDDAEANEDISALRGILKNIREIIAGFFGKMENAANLAGQYSKEIENLKSLKEETQAKAAEAKKEEEALYVEYAALKSEAEKDKNESREAEKNIFRIMAKQKEFYAELNIVKDKESKLAIVKDELNREISEGVNLLGREISNCFDHNTFNRRDLSAEEKEIANEDRRIQDDRRRAIEKVKIRIEDAGAGGGDDIMKEYKEVSERDSFLSRELEDLEKSAVSLDLLIKDLNEKLDVEFKEGLEKINEQFQKFFTIMFGGGRASIKTVKQIQERKSQDDIEGLEMAEIKEEEKEKTEEGIEIEINLPRKKIKGLDMLSGGERALVSIALLFALSQINPPPFIILDETDAALDEVNSKKYGDMVADLSRLSQLILVTHNRETMSRANVLYGITMGGDGISKTLSVNFEEAAAVAK